MVSAAFVKGVILVLALGGVMYSWYVSRKTPTDDKHVGVAHFIFTIALILFVLVVSDLPWIKPIKDGMVYGIDAVSAKIAENYNKQQSTTPGPVASTATAFPPQPPTDFVEWVTAIRIQPKAGVSLPHGWRVSFTDGAGTIGLVDKPIDVDAARTISVYWDPNNLILPGQASSPPVEIPNRP